LVSNLVFNAAQSIDQKGTITIATCNQRQTAPAENLADASEAPQAPATEAGETAARLVIEVRDQGRGIPQPHLDKIFEPFFTTKAQAAGMGLPAVYGIAKSHGGDVEVESTVGRGSCFRVQLPAASTAAQTSDEHPVYKDPRTTPTVLVVDDEPQVRQVLARLLSTGHEALQVYQARREEIGLVILDMVMPAMNGDECFRRLKAIDPDVKTLLATGHTEDQKVQRLLDEGVQGFLPKPFTHKRISAAVHNVLHVE
jgi:CheY-like chemotaxis protein